MSYAEAAYFRAVMEEMKVHVYQVAAAFSLWGLHVALACYATRLIWNRGLRNSRPRQFLSGLVILMQAASTVYVIIVIEYTRARAVEMQQVLDATRQIVDYNLVLNWISRLNFCLSDLTGIWRAWALWLGSRLIRWVLGVSMAVATVSTLTNATTITLDSEVEFHKPHALVRIYFLRALLYIPLLVTNAFATMLISYKAWHVYQIILLTTRAQRARLLSHELPLSLTSVEGLVTRLTSREVASAIEMHSLSVDLMLLSNSVTKRSKHNVLQDEYAPRAAVTPLSMSANDGDESNDFIAEIEVTFYLVAAAFALWGLHIALACYSNYLLWNRGLRNSRPRQCLFGVVTLMLAASTAYMMVLLESSIAQISVFSGQDNVGSPLSGFDFQILNWMSRLNFCLSDVIVVWRAWVLWPGSRSVHWMLGIFVAITAVCTTTNAIALSTFNFSMLVAVTHSGKVNPLGLLYVLRALLFIPLLSTNILATLLICKKAWVYHKEIRSFMINKRDGAVASACRSSFRMGRVLALLIETGALYIILMTINLVNDLSIDIDAIGFGHSFFVIWPSIMVEISAIYPTAIIIFVSKFMSQEYAISSFEKPDEGLLPRPNVAERANGNHTLSTIQFDIPQLGTRASLSSAEDSNDDGRKDTGGKLAVV